MNASAIVLCASLILVASASASPPGNAQTTGPAQTDERSTPTIRVAGEATVTASPDQVEIDTGVTTQAETSQEAATRNATQLSRVLEALKARLGADARIQTISYSLSPDYRYPKEGGEPTITGYRATNIVRVTLNDLERLGDVIDVAAKGGANQVRRIQFTLKDELAAQTEALRKAATKAKTQAEALASALGVRIVRLQSATESEPVVRPFQTDMMSMRAGAAAPATPIQPGTIEVSATVTLTFEIAGPQ